MLRATLLSGWFAVMTKMVLAIPAQGKYHIKVIGYLLNVSGIVWYIWYSISDIVGFIVKF